MKKAMALVLALVFVLCAVPAFAAGKLETSDPYLYIIEGYSNYAYGYVKVTNTGDKAIKVNSGLFEVYDADGNAICSEDYVSRYAEYLQPGEYTYCSAYERLDEGKGAADADDFIFDISGKAENDKISLRLPVDTAWAPDVKNGYWTYNYMIATVTNNTDQPLYDVEVVLALLDADGNILYMDSEDMYSSKAIMPGSSIMVRKSVSDSFMEYFNANGITPASVDAIAFVNIDA